MTERVWLQRLAEVRDPVSGEQKQVVAEEIAVSAEWKSYLGSERIDSGREVSRGYTGLIIRHVPGINGQSWRVRDSSNRLWDINGEPRRIARRQGLELFLVMRDY